MIDEKWEESVFMMTKHKLLETLEELNKCDYHNKADIEEYKNALKALYYLLSIEKSR